MSNIPMIFNASELALAAYANLTPGVTDNPIRRAALVAAGLSAKQAEEFAKKYPEILTQYTDTPAEGGLGTSLSATVFKDTAGNLTLAIRGTLELAGTPNDLLPTDREIWLSGAGFDQIVALWNWWQRVSHPAGTLVPQYHLTGTPNNLDQAVYIQSSVGQWLEPTTSATATGTLVEALGTDGDHKLDVTGHSLGGHLAMAFGALFPSDTNQTTVFNAPGFKDTVAVQTFFGKLGGTIPSGVATTNVIADEATVGDVPWNGIAGLHSRPGVAVDIPVEDQWQSDESNPANAKNHSQQTLTDALAVYATLAQLDPSLSSATFKAILGAATVGTAAGLERVVDTLERAFGVNTANLPTGNTNRDALYQAIYGLLQNALFQQDAGLAQIQSLTSLTRDQIVALAQTDLATRYALANLNPFTLTGDDGLYAQHNTHGELDLYNSTTSQGKLTDLYLQDRAAMLNWLMQFNTQDIAPATTPFGDTFFKLGQFGDRYYFQDVTTNTQIRLGETVDILLPPTDFRHIVFGSDDAETLMGGETSDHLYGGSGNDTLNGGAGADHLEGNLGDDTLYGGFGNDVLLGGQGFDTYRAYANEGLDTIQDADGQGQIFLDNALLEGGNRVAEGLWQSADKQHTFRLVGDTLSIDAILRIEGFQDGDLGLHLGDAPIATFDVQQNGTDLADLFYGRTAHDALEGHGRLTRAVYTTRIDAGAGNDLVMGEGTYRYEQGNFGLGELAPGQSVTLADTLYGGGGNDFLTGNAGDDHLDGGTGNDFLVGGNGADFLDGGDGNDTLIGLGENRYAFHANAVGNGGWNENGIFEALWQIWGGAFQVDAPTLFRNSDTGLYWINTRPHLPGATTDQILRVQYHGATYDLWYGLYDTDVGTTLPDTAADILLGGAGDDILEGDAGDDYLDGGADNDWLIGNAGNDLLDGGAGNDQLIAGEGDDTLLGGEGDDEAYGETGNDMLYGGAGNDLLMGEEGDDTLHGQDGDDELQGDAVGLDGQYHGNDRLDGGEGDDRLFGMGGDDVLLGGAGNDELQGDTVGVNGQYHGNDLLDGGEGDDRLFGMGGDDVLLGGAGNDTLFGDLNGLASPYHGNDTLDGGAGDDILDAGGGNDTLTGGDGNDALAGEDGDDLLAGGAGNDVLIGGDGDDTYLFDLGDEVDTITENNGTFSTDVLRFGDGIVAADITAWRNGNNLELRHANGTDRVILTNWYTGGGSQIDQVAFADGTQWNAEQLTSWSQVRTGTVGNDVLTAPDGNGYSLFGLAGDDILFGGTGNDLMEGGPGNDTLSGGKGNDIYVFNLGDGVDTINEIYGAFFTDILRLGAGIEPDDIRVVRNGFDLELHHANGADKAIVANWYAMSGGYHFLDRVEFADGTQWEQARLTTSGLTVVGTEANETLMGLPQFNDILLGMGGNDTLIGGGGNDRLDGGEGADVYGATKPDGGVFEFSDSYTWLNPYKPADSGDDTYIFGRGSGQDLVYRYEPNRINSYGQSINWDGQDSVELKEDVRPEDVTLTYKPNELTLGIADTTDTITILLTPLAYAKEITSVEALIYEIRFANGIVWDTAQITEIIHEALDSDQVLYGFAGNEVLHGDGGNDQLFGLDGNDFLDGGDGDDFLDGGDGDDLLDGGNGDDVLDGGMGADIIRGGKGNDILYSKGYGDTYEFNLGDGVDTIIDSGSPWSNTPDMLKFGAGINPGDISLVRSGDIYIEGSGDNLEFRLANGVDRVVVNKWFASPHANPDSTMRVVFADGRSFVLNTLLLAGPGNEAFIGTSSNDVLMGYAGNDSLSGGDGNDWLDGGIGKDKMIGGGGDDTYTVDNIGDSIYENADEGLDTVDSAVTWSLGANLENLTLTGASNIDGSGNTLDNTLVGNRVGNRLNGDAGNDTLFGNTPGVPASPPATVSSLVVYAKGTPVEGVYPIMQVFVGGTMVQQFTVDASGYTAYTIDPASLGVTASKIDIVFTNDAYRPDAGEDRNLYVEKIVVNGETMRASDHGVIYDRGVGSSAFDGFNLHKGQEAMPWSGAMRFTLGDNDMLDGGTGADRMVGGDGNDTYVVDDAGDTVVEAQNEGTDTVISSISLTLGDNLENLTLTGSANIAGTGNTLNNLLLGNAYQNILDGNAGDDTLIGGAGDDILEGGSGIDTMFGGLGNDIYTVDDTGDIAYENANEGLDTVVSSVTWTLKNSLENLTLSGASSIDGTGNELNNVLRGNNAANTLHAGLGDDVLAGGQGNDSLQGAGGDDIYLFTRGDGVDEISDEQTTSVAYTYTRRRRQAFHWSTETITVYHDKQIDAGSDTLHFGSDIALTDLDPILSGTNIVFGVRNVGMPTPDQITLKNQTNNMSRIEYLEFADGERYSLADWMIDTNGNNHLVGNDEDNLLFSGTGNDTLSGGIGNDTYLFDLGDGIDTLMENDTTVGNTDLLRFGPGIDYGQLWLSQAGSDLDISVIGTTDKITIQNWYAGSANHIERFEAGGRTLLDSKVDLLVQAMAAFTPPAAGQTTLPDNYRQALEPVLAANWQ